MSVLKLPMLSEINEEGIFFIRKQLIEKYFPETLKIEGNRLISLDENVIVVSLEQTNSGGTAYTKGGFDCILISSDVDFEFNFDINWLRNPTLQLMISFNEEIYEIIKDLYHNKKSEYGEILYGKETDKANKYALNPFLDVMNYYEKQGKDPYHLSDDDFCNFYKLHKGYSENQAIEELNDYWEWLPTGSDWYGYSELYHINIPKYKIDKDIIITGSYRGCKELAPEVEKFVDVSSYERIYMMNI